MVALPWGPFSDEAMKGQCTGCCCRRGSGYQRAAHRRSPRPHMASLTLTRCLHQSHLHDSAHVLCLSALCVGATSDLRHATASSTSLYSGYNCSRHYMHAGQKRLQ